MYIAKLSYLLIIIITTFYLTVVGLIRTDSL